MKYRILKDGVVVNTIVADEAFVTEYCVRHGYTFEKMPDPIRTPDESASDAEQSVWDELDAAFSTGYREGVDSV